MIQPWFSALGHPAQSLLNTVTCLAQGATLDCLVAIAPDFPVGAEIVERLGRHSKVFTYSVSSSSIREGTIRSFRALREVVAERGHYDRFFFLDAHLVLLAALWPVFARSFASCRLRCIYLTGPERVLGSSIAAWLVRRFLERREVGVFLRTEELTDAWRRAFLMVPAERIRYLPSLEIPDADPRPAPASPTARLRFGVLGQIRRGKGLEWLVPLFKGDAALGQLTVVGAFNSADERAALQVLRDFEGFHERFLSEQELLAQAVQQDYLLMLYDAWDPRMESAVLYLAARAHRPVVAYGDGWCGRMIRTFGCGVLAPKAVGDATGLLHSLPRPGTLEYDRLLAGMRDFRDAHSCQALRPKFLEALLA